jgi:hypothetical protein
MCYTRFLTAVSKTSRVVEEKKNKNVTSEKIDSHRVNSYKR